MSFLFPEFLWAFLVLLIPIIIHLFNFKKYKTLYFSSLNFIKHVDQKTRSTQQLKHILVLLSRLLAFIFLVLAFSQPYLNDGKSTNNSKNTIICLYLDNSFSMQARGPEGQLISEAREKAQEIIDQAPLDAQFIVGTNAMSGREQHVLNKIDALEKLDNINFSPLPKSISQITKWQIEIIENAISSIDSNTTINYFLFSDFQQSNTATLVDSTYNGINFFPVQLLAENLGNIYIDSAWFTSPIHKIDAKNELNIRAFNSNKEDLKNVELTVKIGQYNKTIFIDIPANNSKTTSLVYANKTVGFKTGEIKITDKNIFFDDAFFISYEVQENNSILILNGEDAVPNIEMVYNLDDFYVTTSKPITGITKDDFTKQDLVVINGANELSSGIVNYLTDFIHAGGSISLFPGKNPKINEWNNLLGKIKLAQLGNTIPSGNKIKSLNYADPFFKGMFIREPTNLNLPSVTKTFRAISSNSRTTNLIELQNGLPLLAYNEYEGKAFMFYSSIHPDFGNYTQDDLFSSTTLKIGELSSRKQPLFLIIGQNSKYPVYTNIETESAIHIKNSTLDFIPQREEIGGVQYLSINKIDDIESLTSGNYSIETNQQIGNISLNYNRSESNLTTSSIKDIEVLFGNNSQVTINQIGSGSSFSPLEINKPFSYWRWCIILTLIFIFAEMLLIRLLK